MKMGHKGFGTQKVGNFWVQDTENGEHEVQDTANRQPLRAYCVLCTKYISEGQGS